MKKWIAAAFVCIFAAAFGIRYHFLNEKYPAAQVREYSLNDVILLEGIELKNTERELLDQEDFFEKYNIPSEMTDYYEHHPTKFLIAQFWMKNTEDEKKNYLRAFSEDAVEYQAFSNGEDMSFLKYVNEDSEWNGYLLPGEEKSIALVYPIPKSLLTDKHWEQAQKLDYAIVLRNYKEKLLIR